MAQDPTDPFSPDSTIAGTPKAVSVSDLDDFSGKMQDLTQQMKLANAQQASQSLNQLSQMNSHEAELTGRSQQMQEALYQSSANYNMSGLNLELEHQEHKAQARAQKAQAVSEVIKIAGTIAALATAQPEIAVAANAAADATQGGGADSADYSQGSQSATPAKVSSTGKQGAGSAPDTSVQGGQSASVKQQPPSYPTPTATAVARSHLETSMKSQPSSEPESFRHNLSHWVASSPLHAALLQTGLDAAGFMIGKMAGGNGLDAAQIIQNKFPVQRLAAMHIEQDDRRDNALSTSIIKNNTDVTQGLTTHIGTMTNESLKGSLSALGSAYQAAVSQTYSINDSNIRANAQSSLSQRYKVAKSKVAWQLKSNNAINNVHETTGYIDQHAPDYIQAQYALKNFKSPPKKGEEGYQRYQKAKGTVNNFNQHVANGLKQGYSDLDYLTADQKRTLGQNAQAFKNLAEGDGYINTPGPAETATNQQSRAQEDLSIDYHDNKQYKSTVIDDVIAGRQSAYHVDPEGTNVGGNKLLKDVGAVKQFYNYKQQAEQAFTQFRSTAINDKNIDVTLNRYKNDPGAMGDVVRQMIKMRGTEEGRQQLLNGLIPPNSHLMQLNQQISQMSEGYERAIDKGDSNAASQYKNQLLKLQQNKTDIVRNYAFHYQIPLSTVPDSFNHLYEVPGMTDKEGNTASSPIPYTETPSSSTQNSINQRLTSTLKSAYSMGTSPKDFSFNATKWVGMSAGTQMDDDKVHTGVMAADPRNEKLINQRFGALVSVEKQLTPYDAGSRQLLNASEGQFYSSLAVKDASLAQQLRLYATANNIDEASIGRIYKAYAIKELDNSMDINEAPDMDMSHLKKASQAAIEDLKQNLANTGFKQFTISSPQRLSFSKDKASDIFIPGANSEVNSRELSGGKYTLYMSDNERRNMFDHSISPNAQGAIIGQALKRATQKFIASHPGAEIWNLNKPNNWSITKVNGGYVAHNIIGNVNLKLPEGVFHHVL